MSTPKTGTAQLRAAEADALFPPFVVALMCGTGVLSAFLANPAVDDAYIVYRYVDRAIAGAGLTFNDGEWVEGYTSLLWTVLLTALVKVSGASTYLASIVLNIALLAVTVPVLHGLLRELGAERPIRQLALVMFVGSALYAEVVFLGLELGLFGLVLTGFCWALFRFWRAPSWTAAVALGTIGIALSATRPEMLPLTPLFVLLSAVVLRRDPSYTGVLRRLGLATALWASGVVLIAAVRLSVYGDLLPNSVTAKAMRLGDPNLLHDLRWSVRLGLLYLWDAYLHVPVFALALVAAVAASRRLGQQRVVLALLCPVLISSVAVVQNGGDWMPFWRFVTMYTPIYVALFALVCAALARRGRIGLYVGAALVVVHIIGSTVQASFQYPDLRQRDDGSLQDLYERIGRSLNPVWMREDILIPESTGRLGYAAPSIYIHDPAGLTDRHLAHDPAAERDMFGRMNWAYSLGLNPAIVAFHYWEHHDRWQRDGWNYAQSYRLYWLPPTVPHVESRGLFVLVRLDRDERYGAVITAAGGTPTSSSEAERIWRTTGHATRP